MAKSTGYKIIDDNFEAGRKALRFYVAGFIVSLLLTFIPYYMVSGRTLDTQSLLFWVVTFGMIQLVVQVIFFLHLHPRSRPHWNMIIFVYTMLIVLFLVIGSMWIMYHLNTNMMGVSPFKSNEGYIPSRDQK